MYVDTGLTRAVNSESGSSGFLDLTTFCARVMLSDFGWKVQKVEVPRKWFDVPDSVGDGRHIEDA